MTILPKSQKALSDFPLKYNEYVYVHRVLRSILSQRRPGRPSRGDIMSHFNIFKPIYFDMLHLNISKPSGFSNKECMKLVIFVVLEKC